MPEVVLCGDGDLVRLAPDAGVIDEVPAARLYKDGAILISAQERTVAERRRLSFSGIAIVAMVLGRGRIASYSWDRASLHTSRTEVEIRPTSTKHNLPQLNASNCC